MPTNTKKRRGGPRPNSGRPPKPNKEDYIQVTCVLRKDTVEKLKAGAGGKEKFFGAFLQFHLDRFPVPSHEEYLAMKDGKPHFELIKRRRTPVIFGGNVAAARRPPKPSKPVDPAMKKFLQEISAGVS